MVLTPSTMLALGTRLPPFSLEDSVSGRKVSEAEFAERPLVVAVICNHCPYVKHIRSGIADMGRYCERMGVGMVAVSANDPESHPEDSPSAMAEEARRVGYSFPYLFDAHQTFARALKAACTPEFYLFDQRHLLAYRGQMDDARPKNDRPNDGADLKAAIACVCEGRAPSSAQKPSIGCNIKWKPGNEPLGTL